MLFQQNYPQRVFVSLPWLGQSSGPIRQLLSLRLPFRKSPVPMRTLSSTRLGRLLIYRCRGNLGAKAFLVFGGCMIVAILWAYFYLCDFSIRLGEIPSDLEF
jgi:hypothetical protein